MSSCPFGQLLIRLGQTLEGSDPCTRFCAWSQFHYLWILKYMVHQTKDFCFPSFFVFCLLINNLMTAQTSHRDVLRSRLKDMSLSWTALKYDIIFESILNQWIYVGMAGGGGEVRENIDEPWFRVQFLLYFNTESKSSSFPLSSSCCLDFHLHWQNHVYHSDLCTTTHTHRVRSIYMPW